MGVNIATPQSAKTQRVDSQRSAHSVAPQGAGVSVASPIQKLQRAVGNRAMNSLLRSIIQPKLTISHPDEPYEREADRVADQVMRMADGQLPSSLRIGNVSMVQRKCACGGGSDEPCKCDQERETVQRHAESSAEVSSVPQSVPQVLRSSGRLLDGPTRNFMESSFGHDFSAVRVHTGDAAGQSARELNAHAYTVGRDIVFAPGQFAPETPEGRRMLAHELTHVLQQNQAAPQIQRWAYCKPARLSREDCPPRDEGEVVRAKSDPMFFYDDLKDDPVLGTGRTGALMAFFDIGRAAIKPVLDAALWKTFLKQIELQGSKWELLGFTDCQGEEKSNTKLRRDRADAIFKILPPKVQSNIVSRDGAPMTNCITENNNGFERGLNRSVAFVLSEKTVTEEEGEVIRTTPVLDCYLDKVKEECGRAASRCAAIQSTYCKDHYPASEDIEKNWREKRNFANRKTGDFPNAAANLKHYLDASGADRVMPVDIFRDDKATKEKLENEHRDKFIEGAKKRLASGALKPGAGQVSMPWTGTANAFSAAFFRDLGLAVGGYTLCSNVKVSASAGPGSKVTLNFDEWKVQAFDCYNWDPGKGIGLSGAGLDDKDLCCLENAGRGKHYFTYSAPWRNTDRDADASAEI